MKKNEEQQTIVSASKLFTVYFFYIGFSFSAQASLKRFVWNKALAKKELASTLQNVLR
jgi:hypothetical protein